MTRGRARCRAVLRVNLEGGSVGPARKVEQAGAFFAGPEGELLWHPVQARAWSMNRPGSGYGHDKG